MKFLKFFLTKTFWIQLVIILTIIVVTVLLAFQWLGMYTNHNNYITLNDLSGLTIEQAVDQIEDRGLNYAILDSNTYDEELLPRSIIKQDPAPGKRVKDGRTIYLWVNAAQPPMVEVPDLAGKASYDRAVTALDNRGLVLGEVIYRPSVEKNAVLEVMIDSATVEPGTMVRKGTVINLVVGGGTSSTKITVPSVLGKTLSETRFYLASYELNVGFIYYDTIGLIDSSSALIYKQLPAGGDGLIKVGESIDIFLSQDLPESVINKLKTDSLVRESDALNEDDNAE